MPNVRSVDCQLGHEPLGKRLGSGAPLISGHLDSALSLEEGAAGRTPSERMSAAGTRLGVQPEERDRELTAAANALERARELALARSEQGTGGLGVVGSGPEADRQARLTSAELLDDAVVLERVVAGGTSGPDGTCPDADGPGRDELEP